MNNYDDHAVSVVKAETIVGHVPREMSRTFWHFIMHGGSVGCEITGRRTLVGCEITGRRTLGKGGGGGQINEEIGAFMPIPYMPTPHMPTSKISVQLCSYAYAYAGYFKGHR